MVTAMLVAMVVSSLAATGFALSQHNLTQSANDRRQTDAVHAAEAGIDAYLLYLTTAPATGAACTLPTATLTASPPAQYTVSASFYTGTTVPTAIPCAGGVLTGSTPPGAVLIHSVGTAGGQTRTFEAYYGLVAKPTGKVQFYGAVYSYKDATFSGGSAQFSSNTHNGDLYAETGNINLSSSSIVDGVAEARSGTITLSGSAQIMKDATSYGAMNMSGSAIVWGNARSSTSSFTNSAIPGVKGTEYYCTSKSGVGGGSLTAVQNCNGTLPTDRGGYPAFAYNQSDWTTPGLLPEGVYAINTFTDCTSAYNYILAGHTGNQLVYINNTCTLTFPGGAIPVNGNFALVTNGHLALNGGSFFSAGTGAPFMLRLFTDVTQTTTSCGTNKGVTFSGGSYVGANLTVLIQTPCYTDFSGGSFAGTSGQIIAGNVNFSGGSSINATPVTIPSQGFQGGFNELFVYRREVVS
jgi:hypothetical protein